MEALLRPILLRKLDRMTDQTQPRRLAAIVALDIAGFSARMERDQVISAAEVVGLRDAVTEIARAHEGRVFNTAGDGFLLEFASCLTAVKAAIDLAEKCEPKVRVGVHLGDVQVQPNGDLLGHGVNVASRLMTQSAPGSALISAAVRQSAHDRILERFISRGVLKLEKMNETLEVFALDVAGPVQQSRVPIRRKLSAVLFADAHDWSAMREANEASALELLRASREQIIEPQVTLHGGRIVQFIGDCTLAEFPSAVAAVACALAIHSAIEESASKDVDHEPLRYTIGIGLGEVIVDGTDILGDGVDVAARLEALAPVGGVAISRVVRDQVAGKVSCSFEDIGEQAMGRTSRRTVHAFIVRPA